jgi:hypothetical protein
VGRPLASAQLGARLTAIHELPDRLATLEGVAAERAERLLDVRLATARTLPPSGLEPWLVETFGSVDAVREQTVVKVANLVTGEATLFAPLRARRPVDGSARAAHLASEIEATEGDPFCDPEAETPADTFGRVRGMHMVTGGNAAAADSHHAVLVFERHDPLDFDAEVIADLFATARAWADRAREADPEATNYLLIWNCLWRAGGSIIHGHAQALLGSGAHYARLERFRRDAAGYRTAHGSDLAADLGALHADVGLAVGGPSVTTLAHVTPLKEREVVVVGEAGMDERDPSFTAAVAHAVLVYRDVLGVRSFNLALWRPPLDHPDGWEDVPPIVRLVDRGDPAVRASDMGAMELYGTPIVGADPYEVASALRGA